MDSNYLPAFLEQFKNPSSESRIKPFWFWNGRLEKDELIRQIHSFKDMGLGGFFVHGRFGLETPYMSEEWLDALEVTLLEAEKLELEVWLYDENLFPSGIGNTQISKQLQYRSKFIEYNTYKTYNNNNGSYIPASELPKGCELFSAQEISDKVQRILSFDILPDKVRINDASSDEVTLFWVNTIHNPNNMIFGVDYLNPETTARFIESTHEVYKKRFGKWFGKVIKGFFTDEPTLLPWHHDLNWYVRGNGKCAVYTENLITEMQKDGVADITMNTLASAVFFDCGNPAQSGEIRKAYYKTVSRLYTENFFKAYSKWCEENSLMLTGHVLLEEGLYFNHIFQSGPLEGLSNMHIPGVDQLTSRTEASSMSYMVGDTPHMPRVKTNITGPKLISSRAHTSGKRQVISECYGIGGWGMQYTDMRAVLDWLYVLGVNRLCPHAFFYSIEGYRKNDAPPCHYHNSNSIWYRHFADYAARMSWIMSQGAPVADTAVLYPESAFRYSFTAGRQREEDKHISDIYDLVCCALLDIHKGYEILTEEQLISAKANDGCITLSEDYFKSDICGVMSDVSNLRFTTVICPSLKAVDPSIVEKLANFEKAGGKLLTFDNMSSEWKYNIQEELNRDGMANILRKFFINSNFEGMQLRGQNSNKIYTLCRRCEQGYIWLFVNTDNSHTFEGNLSFKDNHIIKLCPLSGQYGVVYNSEVPLKLLPNESALFLLSESEITCDIPLYISDTSAKNAKKAKISSNDWEFKILGYNSLPVNDWTFSVHSEGMGYKYRYTKNIISECEVNESYIVLDNIEFRSAVMGSVELSVNINGKSCKQDGWYIDKGFKKFRIEKIQKGSNIMQIEMHHSSWSGEPHPLSCETFIIGKFQTFKRDGEWIISPMTDRFSLAPWTSQGYALYSGQACYSKSLMLPDGDKICFELDNVYWSAQLFVDEEDMGICIWAPWRWNIPASKRGKYVEIKLVVTNTLANYFGEERTSGPDGNAYIYVEEQNGEIL